MSDAQNKYDRNFKTKESFVPETSKLEAAFKQASDIRKFEIELYWKRAGYFWAFIAVAFAGYFAILSSQYMPNKFFLSFVVGAIGFVFTFAWHLVNRGSKYWQENWENHLDLLEDGVTGPLYKTRLERPKEEDWAERFVTGPRSVSVSKVKQWVSVFVLFVWLTLCAYSSANLWICSIIEINKVIVVAYLFVTLVALLFCYLMFGRRGGTHQDDHFPNMRIRRTIIKEELEKAPENGK
jgi:hypothetical protein